jgi:hypothetical protein
MDVSREDGLARALASGISVEFGQLTLRAENEGTVLVAGPGAAADTVSPTPAALRERVRYDERGRYRPLSGAKSMPGGWCARIAEAALPDALDALYPLALEHLAAGVRAELRVVGLEEVLERQAGRYSVAASLDADGRRVASEVLCRQCVRVPVWRGEQIDAAEHGGVASIPCPEPCSVLVSLCREAALWQQSRPVRSEPDRTVAFAAFETPGNEMREAYLAAR